MLPRASDIRHPPMSAVGSDRNVAANALGDEMRALVAVGVHRAVRQRGTGLGAFRGPGPSGRYDVVFDTVGSAATRALAIEHTRPGGHIVLPAN
jgi:threonine dehydrogenase-like Zn-dependent dehydrogenase